MLPFGRGVPVFVKQLGAKPFHIARAVRIANVLNGFMNTPDWDAAALSRPVPCGASEEPFKALRRGGAMCSHNFAAAISIAAGCLAALVINRCHPQKFRALTNFLTNFAASVPKGVCMREQFRKGNLR